MLSKIKPPAIILAVILIAIASIVLPLLAQIPGSASPQLRFRETDQTLPAGLWRLRLNGDAFTLERNTHASGNFGTVATPLSISASGVMTAVSILPLTTDTYNLGAVGNRWLDMHIGGKITSGGFTINSDVTTATGTPQLLTTQLADTTNAAIAISTHGANPIGSIFRFLKSRSSSGNDADTALLLDDEIGVLNFLGSDGAGYKQFAAITVEVDGTVGMNDAPGRIVFWTTPDGSAQQGRRWHISNGGDFYPFLDNNTNLGGTTNRIYNGFFSGSVRIGTNTPVATDGSLALGNASRVYYRNAANNTSYTAMAFGASDRVIISGSGQDIQWGVPLVALGGGASATLGTVGGSGPATATQNTWMRVFDSSGVAYWVPAFK